MLLDRIRRRNGNERQASADASWAHLSATGWGNVSARQAEQLSPVFACVDVISSAISSLPPKVFERSGTTRVEVVDSDIAPLLAAPNRWQTWPDFVSWFMAQCLLHGNAVAVADGGSLWPCRWESTGVQLEADGRVQYDYSYGSGAHNVSGVALDDRVVHMRDRSDDGVVGVSRLKRCAATIGLSWDQMDAAVALWENGAFPSGAVVMPGRMSPGDKDSLRTQLESRFAGARNRGRIILLDGGMEWREMFTSPRESEALRAREFQVAEICRVFEVPPPMVADYSNNTFTNASTAGQWFSKFTLGSWVRRFEAAFSRVMLPVGQSLELDMSAFSRGDESARWEAYKIALEQQVLAPEDVKRLEGWQ